jgi:hypothetical protein
VTVALILRRELSSRPHSKTASTERLLAGLHESVEQNALTTTPVTTLAAILLLENKPFISFREH